MGITTYITDVDAAHDNINSLEAVEERKASTLLSIGIFIACALLTFILSLKVKEDLRRVNYKREGFYIFTESEAAGNDKTQLTEM